MSKEVEVRYNPKKRLTEVNKDRDVQYSVGVEIAQTNRPKYQQISQERMNREPQSTPEIIFKDYNFIGVRHWKGVTNGWPPSGGDAVRKHAHHHHSFELRVGVSDRGVLNQPTSEFELRVPDSGW